MYINIVYFIKKKKQIKESVKYYLFAYILFLFLFYGSKIKLELLLYVLFYCKKLSINLVRK